MSFSLIVNEFNINLFFLWKLRGYREIYIGFIYLITLQSSQWLHRSRYSVSVVIIMPGICRGQKIISKLLCLSSECNVAEKKYKLFLYIFTTLPGSLWLPMSKYCGLIVGRNQNYSLYLVDVTWLH